MGEFEHENAGAALLETRSLTKHFELPEYACVMFRALMSRLNELEHDLTCTFIWKRRCGFLGPNR